MTCRTLSRAKDYNFEANFWGLYANNRLPQAQPQYRPILDYAPKAKLEAEFYGCPGLHYPGKIVPWGHGSTLVGEPWASMALHSNGVYLALNMVQEWEYSRNRTTLRDVVFPFCRDVLRFYQCWMTRRPDGSWVNENDQSNECNPPAPITEARKRAYCYQNNTVISNAFARRVCTRPRRGVSQVRRSEGS